MTIRDCYNACLIELNKVQAPSLLLNDFIYLLNKNIQEYFNKKYTSFEKIQQNTDDLRQLINWVTLDATNGLKKHVPSDPSKVIYFTSWDCPLPSDYVHILGCRAIFEVPSKRCKDCRIQVVGLNKLDTNQAPQVGSNWYMRPSHSRPYYQIINIEQGGGSIRPDLSGDSGTSPNSTKKSGERYGNSTQPIMQIICGDDPSYQLKAVEIQYLQAPRFASLTQADLDAVVDTTDTLEFSDYVCNEIIKQLVTQILENAKDERIQTFIPVNASIAQN